MKFFLRFGVLFFIPVFFWSCSADVPGQSFPSRKRASSMESIPMSLFQNGDLIFHTSQSSQSKAIQMATNSQYSHMGILYVDGSQIMVFEAVQPVKMTHLNQWINRGKEGHFVVKRLKNSDEWLSLPAIEKMKKTGKKYLGKDYDLKFEWSDDKIYCSELVWKIYKEALGIEIGKLQQFKDFDLSAPEVRKKVRERHGSSLPMEEWVITPDQMFHATNLETVYEH